MSETRPLPERDAGAAERLIGIVAALARETHPGRRFDVGPDSRFERDLGMDSLARVELMLRVSSAFGVQLPEAALNDAQTPRELLHYLGGARASAGGDWQRFEALQLERAEGLPERAETLVEVLRWHVARHPKRLHVLLYGEAETPQRLSYGELYEAARCMASGLVARGLKPGQTVALMLPTGLDYLAVFFGTLIAGAVPVPIYPPARMSQVEEHLQRHARILANAECALLVTVAQAKPVAFMLRAAVPSLKQIVTPEDLRVPATPLAIQPRGGDIAFLQYTSGSTGDPKGVVLTHANLLANIRAMGAAARASSEDVFVSWLPLYHDMGLIGAWFCPLYFAMPLVLLSPLAFLARPARWLHAIHHHRGTISGAPNFAYELTARKLAEADIAGLDLSSWRIAFNGAEPVSPATLEAFAARFAPYGLKPTTLAPVYGLAECSVGLALPPPGRSPRIDAIAREAFALRRAAEPVASDAPGALRVAGCGMAIPGHAMRVVDEAGRELGERRVGRLQFQGPSATRGYYRNPQASARLFSGDWLETGDYAYLADGEVFLTGREKDLIIRGGRNLYPYELEQAVGEIEGVRRGCVAVFASPDPATGSERLVVLAETRLTDAGAREALRARIDECAADILGLPADEVVLAPPATVLKTSSGKIRRAACRQRYEAGLVGKALLPAWRIKLRLAGAALAARVADWRSRVPALAYGAWVWTVFGLLAPPVWSFVSLTRRPRLAREVVHRAARLYLLATATPLRCEGIERLPAGAHVLVCNHVSYLDAIFMVAALPPRISYTFVAKREFADHWATRGFFRGLDAVLVERFDARLGAEGAEQVVEALAAGRSAVVFPEGTFTPQDGLRPFRMGAFFAAARAGVPLVCSALAGVRPMLRDKTWLPRPGRPVYAVGAVLRPEGDGWGDAVGLRSAARAEIVRLSGEADLEA